MKFDFIRLFSLRNIDAGCFTHFVELKMSEIRPIEEKAQILSLQRGYFIKNLAEYLPR